MRSPRSSSPWPNCRRRRRSPRPTPTSGHPPTLLQSISALALDASGALVASTPSSRWAEAAPAATGCLPWRRRFARRRHCARLPHGRVKLSSCALVFGLWAVRDEGLHYPHRSSARWSGRALARSQGVALGRLRFPQHRPMQLQVGSRRLEAAREGSSTAGQRRRDDRRRRHDKGDAVVTSVVAVSQSARESRRSFPAVFQGAVAIVAMSRKSQGPAGSAWTMAS